MNNAITSNTPQGEASGNGISNMRNYNPFPPEL